MYELLSEPIRRYIRDKRWEALRPIQEAAIKYILSTEKNYILASRTASGKTEAAFLPILSKVKFREPGVRVLYISPLIALINDQFKRVEELCAYLDVPVTKWHGEANRTLKEKLIKSPSGVVLITPESLEAMFVNAPQQIVHLFSNLEFVIIDEIHAFAGTDRGLQLRAILSRLKFGSKRPFRVVGLSATIGDFQQVKQLTADMENTTVLRDKTAKEMSATFKFFEMDGADLPQKLIDDVYRETRQQKVLAFPNSRGRAEELAVRLKKEADRQNGHPYYFSHHSSVDRELREYIEHFVKENRRYPFLIACTSTLELGIDIGSVDRVLQIDAPHSIASLVQRTGRSGRIEGAQSNLLCYATGPWSLLQSLACLQLYYEEFIEPTTNSGFAHDILLHQLLSTVKQLSGCTLPTLLQRLNSIEVFADVDEQTRLQIIKYLLDKDMLEQLGQELIIGVEGERVVNSKDFYSVFKSEPTYRIVHQDKTIGEIPLLSIIAVDENILLAAKIWKVVDIDQNAKKISVQPAKDGRKPKFFGSGGDIHPRVREKMLELLLQEQLVPELDEVAMEALRQFRDDFSHYQIEDLQYDRPVLIKDGSITWYSFQGSKINRTLHALFRLVGTEVNFDDSNSSFIIRADLAELERLISKAITEISNIDAHLAICLEQQPELINFSKWGAYLPFQLQCVLLKEKHYDFEGAQLFLKNLRLVALN
ncbi:DEAD/DEAH box helicase [Mucilaginibacter sp.]